MVEESELVEAYEYAERMYDALKDRKQLLAPEELGQAANDLNLHLRRVQASPLGQRETVRGMRELRDDDTEVALLSRAAMLLAVLRPHLYPTSASMPGFEPDDLTG